MDKLTEFLRARIYAIPGQRITLHEFYLSFLASLPARERPLYPKRELVDSLRKLGFCVGRSTGNQFKCRNQLQPKGDPGIAWPTHDHSGQKQPEVCFP
jgi:hypothetical protein